MKYKYYMNNINIYFFKFNFTSQVNYYQGDKI